MHRRQFLKGAAALAAGSAWQRTTWASPVTSGVQRPGLQLFTVMPDLERDFDGTLAEVADIGYREVETIGAFGRDVTEVRAALDRHGLTSPSQHLVPGDLYEAFKKFAQRELSFEQVKALWTQVMTIDKVDAIIQEAAIRARALGQKYIVWQIVWPEEMVDRPALSRFCQGMNRAGALCRDEGLVFCFHNHADEFRSRDGFVPFDFILENTDPDLVKIELDAHWATQGGVDPVRYLAENRGRIVQLHLKDGTAEGEITTIGRGIIDFARLLDAARHAHVSHMYVEYDRAEDPMGAVRESWQYLTQLP